MKHFSLIALPRWLAAACLAVGTTFLPCASVQAQSYSVSPARPATVESIREVVEHKNSSSPLGMTATTWVQIIKAVMLLGGASFMRRSAVSAHPAS